MAAGVDERDLLFSLGWIVLVVIGQVMGKFGFARFEGFGFTV